jgi:Cellulase (glycosyl hydrolase family 5)
MAGHRQHLLAVSGAVCAGLVLATPAAAASTPWVTTQGNRFVRTDTGRVVVLRGVNVAAGPNVTLQNRVVELGANLVRIHVRWSDLQPIEPAVGDPGWNAGLLGALQAQITWYAAHRVNVLIDLHQFRWSAYFAPRTGGGIPAWFYTRVHRGEYPVTERGEARAFRDFYIDPEAIRLYSQLARMVATRFGGDPNVIGYEVLNEPLAPSGHAGTQAVISFEAAIRRAFAAVDPRRTVFVMTRTGGDKGLLDASFQAFGSLRHVALDYHAYFAGVPGTGMTFDGEDWRPGFDSTHMQATTNYHGTLERQRQVLLTPILKANDLRMPLLVGEWGSRRDDRHGSTYQAQMLALFERYGLSWARWALSAEDPFGILGSSSQPTAAFRQLQRALATGSRPPPGPGPHLPWLGTSRRGLSLARAEAHPIWLCYRPAAASRPLLISMRHSDGRPLRRISVGAVAANRFGCVRWRGGNGRGSHVRPQKVYIRASARYAVGHRFSVWHTILVKP